VRSATRVLTYFRNTAVQYYCHSTQWNRHLDDLHDTPRLRHAVLSDVKEQPELFLDELADAVNVGAVQVTRAVEVCSLTVARVLAHNW